MKEGINLFPYYPTAVTLLGIIKILYIYLYMYIYAYTLLYYLFPSSPIKNTLSRRKSQRASTNNIYIKNYNTCYLKEILHIPKPSQQWRYPIQTNLQHSGKGMTFHSWTICKMFCFISLFSS
jgi:hypothetical protein